MEKHMTKKFEASRIKFMTSRNSTEKICSDVVQDLVAEASSCTGNPLPPLQMLHEYASFRSFTKKKRNHENGKKPWTLFSKKSEPRMTCFVIRIFITCSLI